jgi:WD40 repeat protein
LESNHQILSGSHDGEVKLSTFDSSDEPELKLAAETLHNTKHAKDKPPEAGHRGAVTCLCTNQNGALMASGGADRVVKLWSTAGGGLLKRTFAQGIQQVL